VNGNAYTTTVTGYDDQYRPTGTTVGIPASEGLLGGTYRFGTTYNPDGSVATEVLPAAGGLPAETIVHTYDGVTGLPATTLGATGYVQQSRYNELGQPLQLAMGTSSSSQRTFMQYTYDLPTKRLSETQVRRDAAAGRAAALPSFPLAIIAAEMRDIAARLDLFDTGDAAASVRAAFAAYEDAQLVVLCHEPGGAVVIAPTRGRNTIQATRAVVHRGPPGPGVPVFPGGRECFWR
jgi:hypothetical protein